VRAVILAAGRGTRLGEAAAQRPKCLVELAGRSLLQHQLARYRAEGIEPWLVTGFAAAQLDEVVANRRHNPAFAVTNMVASLMCARELLDGRDEVIVSYGDVAFDAAVLRALLKREDDGLAISIDRGWRALWSYRMEDPLSDAETLRCDGERLVSIGERPRSYLDIEGQYMGLLRFGRSCHRAVIEHFERCCRLDTAYLRISMTELLRDLIALGHEIRITEVCGGWLEVDTEEDLRRYRRGLADGTLASLWRAEP
jgi:L-glutamine-phosphate cytidylyltransferase